MLRMQTRGATVMCAALAFGPVLLPGEACAQSADTDASQSTDTPEAMPNNTAADQRLSALSDGAPGQQGVPVPVRGGRATRQVSVRLNARTTYDSNANRSNDLRPVRRDLSKTDVLFPVGADVNVVLPYGPSLFTLHGRGSYDFHLRNTRLNSEAINLSGGYSRQISRCNVGLDTSFSRNLTQFGDSDFIDSRRNLRTSASAGSSLNCDITQGWRGFGSFHYLLARNSSERRRYSNHDTKSFGGGLNDFIPSVGEIGIVVSMEDTDYVDRTGTIVGVTGGATRIRVKSIGLSFNRATARILQARVQINYTTVADGLPGGSFSGLSGSADIRFMPGHRFTFSLTADRAVRPSLSLNADYNLTTSYSIGAAARITSRSHGQIGYQHTHRQLYGAVAVPGDTTPGEILREDNRSQYHASFNYRLNRRISLLASVVHEMRTSANVLYNYSGTRGTVGVNFRL